MEDSRAPCSLEDLEVLQTLESSSLLADQVLLVFKGSSQRRETETALRMKTRRSLANE